MTSSPRSTSWGLALKAFLLRHYSDGKSKVQLRQKRIFPLVQELIRPQELCESAAFHSSSSEKLPSRSSRRIPGVHHHTSTTEFLSCDILPNPITFVGAQRICPLHLETAHLRFANGDTVGSFTCSRLFRTRPHLAAVNHASNVCRIPLQVQVHRLLSDPRVVIQSRTCRSCADSFNSAQFTSSSSSKSSIDK